MKALVPSGINLQPHPNIRTCCAELIIQKTHIDPAILPPVPASAARCTPDNTGGSNRRPS